MKNRVKELVHVPSSQLIPNPKNWRTHPQVQREALSDMLEEVGIADAILVRETPDGYMIIDGHLRQESIDEEIPCLVIDVNEEEADKLLALYDPLSELAGRDEVLLEGLLDGIEFELPSLQQLSDELKAGGWDGQTPVNPEDLDDYHPDSETVTVRVKNVPRKRAGIAIDAINDALALLQFEDLEVDSL